jgi:hypothetical protein
MVVTGVGSTVHFISSEMAVRVSSPSAGKVSIDDNRFQFQFASKE